jgi:hypothetical protein
MAGAAEVPGQRQLRGDRPEEILKPARGGRSWHVPKKVRSSERPPRAEPADFSALKVGPLMGLRNQSPEETPVGSDDAAYSALLAEVIAE